MSRDRLQRAGRDLLDRLSQPSAAAGLAALLALLVLELAPPAPMLVELGLGTIAVAAAILAMVRRERNGSGRDGGWPAYARRPARPAGGRRLHRRAGARRRDHDQGAAGGEPPWRVLRRRHRFGDGTGWVEGEELER